MLIPKPRRVGRPGDIRLLGWTTRPEGAQAAGAVRLETHVVSQLRFLPEKFLRLDKLTSVDD